MRPHPFQFTSSQFYPVAIAIVTAILTGCTEASIAPLDVVHQAFTQQYPGITPTWHQKPYGYEAVFIHNGLETEAEYNALGQWLETEVEVEEAAFSKAVLDRVRKEYPQYTITKCEIETTPNGTFYEVEITREITREKTTTKTNDKTKEKTTTKTKTKTKDKEELELYFNDRAQPVPNTNEDA